MPACRRVRKACLGTSSEDDALEPYPSIDWESRHACVVAVSNGVGTTGIEGMRGTSRFTTCVPAAGEVGSGVARGNPRGGDVDAARVVRAAGSGTTCPGA
jgi:hypothetical protein